jgi:hypothetical protein
MIFLTLLTLPKGELELCERAGLRQSSDIMTGEFGSGRRLSLPTSSASATLIAYSFVLS